MTLTIYSVLIWTHNSDSQAWSHNGRTKPDTYKRKKFWMTRQKNANSFYYALWVWEYRSVYDKTYRLKLFRAYILHSERILKQLDPVASLLVQTLSQIDLKITFTSIP